MEADLTMTRLLPWFPHVALMTAVLLPVIAAAAGDSAAADARARLTRLADNVYVIEHDDATDEWPHGNTGVIVGRDGVFVIDSGYLPSRARADIALIRRVTDKPVRVLLTTHWHFDHNNGASAYRDAFPGLTLLAERNTARWIELNQNYWKALSTAPESPRREALERLEAGLARGAGPDGEPLDAAGRARLEGVIAIRSAELAELASLEVVAPTQVFDGRLSLDFGGTRIEIEDRGPANSPNDATVWLPEERILFAGDILVRSPLPYVVASWPVHWARVLGDLENVPADFVVPGHGAVMTDHAYTRAMRGLLDATLMRVEALVRKGRSLSQVQDELALDDLRARVPAWNGPQVSDEDWDYTRRTRAERAFLGLRGQGGR
jgi:glyoxylase-like metal-dependent hydrolase (beta-lactamase superfamily II)